MTERRGQKAILARNDRDMKRDERMWRMAAEGCTYDLIAEQEGISRARVAQIVARFKREQGEMTPGERRDHVSHVLEEDIALARSRWRVSPGSGEGRMYARLLERYCRLWGLDAPQKLQLDNQNTTITYTIEADDYIKQGLE
jgi:hypothetical protein